MTFRYKLRTLLILLAVLPPVLAPLSVWSWREYVAWRNNRSHALEPGTGYLGVVPDEELADHRGVPLIMVRPGTPADTAGLMAGDVITSINNRPCRGIDDLDGALAKSAAGSNLAMVVSRDGKARAIAVTLGERPGQPWPSPSSPAP